jgi:hypothetical protein
LPLALVVGINPSTATEEADDVMTGFLTELLRDLDGEYHCGGFMLVNCCDFRDSDPNGFKTEFPAPSAMTILGRFARNSLSAASSSHHGERRIMVRR